MESVVLSGQAEEVKVSTASGNDNVTDARVQGPPNVLTPNFDGMPDELKQMNNWVLWRYLPPKSRGGKLRKVPFQPSGAPASSADPLTWSQFDECRLAYGRGGFSGIGFVFDGEPDENGLVYAGVDFDSQAFEGEGSFLIAELIDGLGSYVETSVSGAGLHVITKANPLASGISHDGIELYTSKRYFAMTGRIEGAASAVVASPAAFAALAQYVNKTADGQAQQNVATNNVVPFELPDWAKGGLAPAFAKFPVESLAAGLRANIEEIRSAVSAIPPSAIATEPGWLNLARGLAHEAAVHTEQAEELWEILDSASRRAPGYHAEDNRLRFERYMNEAFGRENPITIATVFHMARTHGWQGWSPPTANYRGGNFCLGNQPLVWSAPTLTVSFSNIPHRQWLYGTYLIRGEITCEAAPGGGGKTAHAVGMAVEIATGTELLEEKIWRQDLKVLFINAEDGGTEIKRRVWAFCLAHSQKLAGKCLDQLYVVGADDARAQQISFLQTNEKGVSVLNRAGFAVLEVCS